MVLSRIMQASQIEIVIVTLHPFGCCSTIKFTLATLFSIATSLLPYFTCMSHCSVFKVQIFPTAFAVRFEDPIVIRSSNPAAICLVGPSGLEPPTLRLSVVRSSQLSYGPLFPFGGDSRDRTGDLLLARQALSQLSYIPSYLPGTTCTL